MDYIVLAFKLFAATLLVGIAIYSWIYFSQVKKIEKQLGLKIPRILKRALTFLAMLPMIVSLVVIFIVFIELGT